jgi:ribosomal protein S21
MEKSMTDDLPFKKKGMTVIVKNGNLEGAMAQLKRRMNNEGINKELRKRKHFTPQSILKRQRMSEAKLRWKKKYAQIMEIEPTKKRRQKAQKVVNKSVLDIPKNED